MLRKKIFWALVCLMIATGCATRSISNSGYVGDGYSAGGNPFYRGELTEFDIVGAIAPDNVSEQNIAAAFTASKQPIRLIHGAPLLVMQSGAITPDEQFLAEIASYFADVPFSGVPLEKKGEMTKQLRMTAARGGIQSILCFWGVLETAKVDNAGKVLSWIPVAGRIVPDEKQRMRIRLKAILLDAASGRWAMLTPEPLEETLRSAQISREQADQKQVESLKQKGYHALMNLLVAKYVTQPGDSALARQRARD